jgi:hypothetical protein
MQHPFQRLAAINVAEGAQRFLLAAAGPTLYCYDATSGVRVSTWPEPDSAVAGDETADAGSEPRRKKQKRDSTPEGAQEEVKTTKKSQGKGQPGRPEKPNIIKLLCSRDGSYVVIVTGEDKSIHVLSLDAQGLMRSVSTR